MTTEEVAAYCRAMDEHFKNGRGEYRTKGGADRASIYLDVLAFIEGRPTTLDLIREVQS